VPEGVWDELFDSWWKERMSHANLSTRLEENKLADILKREVARVIVSASKEETPVVSATIGVEEYATRQSEGEDGTKGPLSPYQRSLVHNACQWLGMISKTGDYEYGAETFATVTIQGKYCKPDDLALITYDQACKDGAEVFRTKKKRRRQYPFINDTV